MELAFNIELTLIIFGILSPFQQNLNTQVPLESHVNTKQGNIGL